MRDLRDSLLQSQWRSTKLEAAVGEYVVDSLLAILAGAKLCCNVSEGFHFYNAGGECETLIEFNIRDDLLRYFEGYESWCGHYHGEEIEDPRHAVKLLREAADALEAKIMETPDTCPRRTPNTIDALLAARK